MIDLIVLGSAGTKPTFDRNTASYYCKCDGTSFLFDAGEGVQQALLKHAPEFQTNCIIISHKHGDHYYGLIPYLVTMHLMNRVKFLDLLLPADLTFIPELMQIQGIKLCYDLRITYYNEKTVLSYPKFNLSFFKTNHTTYCYGVKLTVPERYTIDSQKIGKISDLRNLKTLQRGISVFDDGKLITPLSVCKEYISTFTLIYGSDSRPLNSTLLTGCKLLVHQATFNDDEIELAQMKRHSSLSEVIALSEYCDNLCLSHLGSKLRRRKLPAGIVYAYDGLKYTISNTGDVS